jgi:CRP/FNR family transcriptional regulator, cyclic AMP receptor protein
MSNEETVEFLATVPLLEGLEGAYLAELARAARRRTVREGEFLWRQGDRAYEMLFVVSGGVSVSQHLPGERTVEMAEVGPGDTLGEIALLDGGGNTMSARVTEPATLLALSRVDFAALLARQHPSAFMLKRRLAALTAARLRALVSHLALSLGGEPAARPAEDAAEAFADLEICGPPDSKYVRRMATFREFDPLALWGFLTSGKYARCPAGRTLIVEGASSAACYLTINGAVEKVLVRGDRRIRVALAGPGTAFGYEDLIDGGGSPFTAISRERALLLVLPREEFERLFHGEDAGARVFLDVIQRDLVASLRQTLRPHARLAASV